MGENNQAALLLRKQLAELNKNPVEGFSAGLIDESDIFKWEVSSGSRWGLGVVVKGFEGHEFSSHKETGFASPSYLYFKTVYPFCAC